LFHDTTEPRLHVPDNAGGSLLFREWWKVAADASSPPVRTASPWSVSRRERKGNGGVNDDAAAAAAAAAASSFTTSFWSNDVSEESRRFSPRRYLSLSFSRWRRGRDFRRERRERERGTEGEKEKERERERVRELLARKAC